LPDAKLGKVVKQSKDVDEPYYEHNHHNAVEDSLDLTLHGKEAIDQPEHHANYANRENNCEKWHFIDSNSSPLFQSCERIAEQHCSPEQAVLVVGRPSQVAAQNIDCDRRGHKEGAYPETPVAVHPMPVRTRARLTMFATFSLGIVFVSGHISPR
jgi:hypothetical protein